MTLRRSESPPAGSGIVPAVPARLALLIVSLGLCVALAEVALRVLTPLPIHELSNRRPNPVLGYVLSSSLPDVDARGFRDGGRTRLEDAEIVVVGDSHAYGVNVSSEASFPAVLERRTGRPVYNMGVGSYGIYQYMMLLEQLTSFANVRDVVLALYLANDLAAHCPMTGEPAWKSLARQRGLETPPCQPGEAFSEMIQRPRSLRERSALLDAAWTLFERFASPAEPAFELADDQRVAIRRSRKHQLATSLANDRVALNHLNSLGILKRAQRQLRAAGIRFSVLLVPSHEEVLVAWSHARGEPVPDELDAIVATELAMKRRYQAFLDGSGIPYEDALPAMVAALDEEVRAGRELYPGADDHPLERGYVAYAEAAEALLARADAQDPHAERPSQSAGGAARAKPAPLVAK